ncbi:MAG: NapC/NirT family cytochrome c [Holophagales bacterium]|nr:NapC/NirT family cytochrome c [Holophagales bacterium]MBK9967977.1 NapC/NirT family cytochrome c [Holophagales bacterium]
MPTARERTALWGRTVFRVLGQNRVSQTGIVVTTATGISMVFLWIIETLRGGHEHPYSGIVLFLVLPAVFVAGLVLIPAGFFLQRRADRKAGRENEPPPPIDLTSPKFRRVFTFVVIATLANATLVGFASYKGLEVMDSVGFCGEACHTVMAPELAAYKGSPHSRIGCVECHIGAGASWFVQSKLSGTRQVVAVALKTYSMPIPSPVRHLRPARETCEQCHWPQRFTGDRVIVKKKYAEDEKNTVLTTVLVMHVGGMNAQGSVGIHGRHLDAGSRISYTALDERRQQIATVSYRDDAGKTVDYASTELKPTADALAKGEVRSMDCVDCHNRPTHAFELPHRGLDREITAGAISRDLPFVKKQALELLKGTYESQDAAAKAIGDGLTAYYAKQYPEIAASKKAEIEKAVQAVQAVYRRNVFPDMKLVWGYHPNNIGHEDFPGCFRCHGGNHESKDGKPISADCEACHQVLAMEEENPEILTQLGLK